MTPRLAITLWLCVAGATQALRHRPYEHQAGSFVRSDGLRVSVVEHYFDGIFGRDPVGVQFRLPDGMLVAGTDVSRDSVIVRNHRRGVEVYWFQSDWFPFAHRVQFFDGYALSDVTTAQKRAASPLVHTRANWLGYVVGLGIAAFVASGWFAVKKIPNSGWLGVALASGVVLVCLVGAFFALILCFAPVSPLVLGLLGLGVFGSYRRLVQNLPPGLDLVEGNSEVKARSSRFERATAAKTWQTPRGCPRRDGQFPL